MRKRKQKRTKKQLPKVFLIRLAASALLFAAAFLMKSYLPAPLGYIRDMLSYNTNLEKVQEAARDIMLKYTPVQE